MAKHVQGSVFGSFPKRRCLESSSMSLPSEQGVSESERPWSLERTELEPCHNELFIPAQSGHHPPDPMSALRRATLPCGPNRKDKAHALDNLSALSGDMSDCKILVTANSAVTKVLAKGGRDKRQLHFCTPKASANYPALHIWLPLWP